MPNERGCFLKQKRRIGGYKQTQVSRFMLEPCYVKQPLPPLYLTTNEVAEILKCTPEYVRILAKTGGLQKLKPAKRMVRFRLGGVAKFMQSKMEAGQ
jgi:excisionase family DNA binding protein